MRGDVIVVTHPVQTVTICAANVSWYVSVLTHSTQLSVT